MTTSTGTDRRTELTVGGMHCGNCVRHDEAGYEVAVCGAATP